jgi:hypothetical protein
MWFGTWPAVNSGEWPEPSFALDDNARIRGERWRPSRHRSSSTWRLEGAKELSSDSGEPIHLDNTGHPAADRFVLTHASRIRVHAFGLSWEDVSGRNNGQHAMFSWRSA